MMRYDLWELWDEWELWDKAGCDAVFSEKGHGAAFSRSVASVADRICALESPK